LNQIRDVRNLLSTLPAGQENTAVLIQQGITHYKTSEERRSRSIRISDSERLENFRKARSVQKRFSPRRVMRECGLNPIPIDGQMAEPELVINERGGYFSGLATCKSQYCPNCMARFKSERITRIHRGLKGAKEDGRSRYFITLTVPRSPSAKEQIQTLSKLWTIWSKMIRYRMAKAGCIGIPVRSLDTTFQPENRNVFHSHFHVIFTLKGEYEGFEEMLAQCWKRAAASLSVKVSLEAQDIRPIVDDEEIGKYAAKFWGMGSEMAAFHQKEGKLNGNQKSYGWMELMGLVSDGSVKATRAYRDFLEAVKGYKTILFAQGWKELEELAPEEEEEEEKEKPKELLRLTVPHEWWTHVRHFRDDLITVAHWVGVQKPEKLGFLENLWKHDYDYELSEEEDAHGLSARLLGMEGAGPTPDRVESLMAWMSLNFPKHLWSKRLD